VVFKDKHSKKDEVKPKCNFVWDLPNFTCQLFWKILKNFGSATRCICLPN
jgi:hypothetical protein